MSGGPFDLPLAGLAFAVLTAKATLLLGAAWLATLGLRKAGAGTRHLVWAGATVAVLLLPLSSALLPSVALAGLPSGAAPETADAGRGASVAATTGGPLRGVLGSPTSDPKARGATPPSAPASPDSAAWGALFVGLVAALYLLVAAVLAARVSAGLLQLRGIRAGARSLENDPAWQAQIAAALDGLGVRQRVRFGMAAGVDTPMTWGAWRPVVLFPEQAARWSPAARRRALLHELAHVRRLDWLVQILVRFACAVYWAHPLVWLAARRTILEAERACDDHVLLADDASGDYAEQLVSLAHGLRPTAVAALGAVGAQRPGQLRARIDSILNPHVRRTRMSRYRLAIVMTIGLIATLLVAPVTLVAQQTPTVTANDAMTELMQAVARNDAFVVDTLLRSRTDPNAGVSGLGTPLIIAAANGSLDIVERLLAAGADPNRTDPAQRRHDAMMRSSLATAAQHGHLEIVRRLLDAGADVEASPRGDATALMEAAGQGHREIVELLLQAGGDADRQITGDGTPLLAASRAGDAELVRRLLAAGADPNRVSPGDGTALIAAARSGDEATVRALLQAGADPNRYVPGDENPMYHAVRSGSDEIVALLVAAGGNVGAEIPGDGNALIQAARSGNMTMVGRLLDAGADPNEGVRGDGNPLIMAAAGGHVEVARLLLDRGADVDRVVRGDENPLIRAAEGGHLEAARLLLDRGADVNLEVRANGEIRSALRMARRGGHDAVVRLLVERGATR